MFSPMASSLTIMVIWIRYLTNKFKTTVTIIMHCFLFFFVGTIIDYLQKKKQNKKQKLFFKIIQFH